MIQFNLLPDVKVNLIKAKKTNRLVVSIAFLATIVSVIILLLMISLLAAQKKHLSDLDKDIKSTTAAIENTKGVDQILTVQNQLHTLPELYAKRPAAVRIPAYLDQTVPGNIVRLDNFSIDFVGATVTVSGNADSVEAVNKYVDTLKFTQYTVDSDTETKTPAFSKVVLGQIGRGENSTSFSVAFNFDPIIFDGTKKITLVVPTTVTTRSSLSSQPDLFGSSTSTEAK
jgi:hypothetical protein